MKLVKSVQNKFYLNVQNHDLMQLRNIRLSLDIIAKGLFAIFLLMDCR